MGLFDDVLSGNQSLIRHEEALDYEYMPKILRFRENEQQYLATAIKPLFSNRSGRNLLIYGAPGIGKTLAVKHVLNELEDETDDVQTVFINCWKQNTSYKVFVEVCEQLGYRFTQNKKTTELQKVALQLLNKKPSVIVFDEIDKAEDEDFIYVLIEGVFHKSLFLITNYKSWLVELDERIRSRLMAELQEFKEYSPSETQGILQERVDVGFVPDCFDDMALSEVFAKTSSIKDIRSGLFLLKNSGLNAEDRSSKKVELIDVQKAITQLDEFTIKNTDELDEEAQFILKVIKQNSGKKIGDMFKDYETIGGKSSYKTFQRRIAKLDEGKFIKVTKQTGAGGNTTIIEKKLTDF